MRSLALPIAAVALGWAPSGMAQPISPPARMPVLTTPRDVSAALRTCWRPPAGLRGLERVDVTARFSLRVDGTLIGPPRISFANLASDTRVRELLVRSVVDALAACAPFNLEPGLAHAVAGRLFAIRLIYRGPAGQGA